MVADGEALLRIVWDPKDFDKDGKLKGAHFSQRDLLAVLDPSGEPRYVSMDRERLICKESVDYRIEKARDFSERRREARFARFDSTGLRQVPPREVHPLFTVISKPFEAGEDGPGSPANDAHAAVISQIVPLGPDDDEQLVINKLRNRLLHCRTATLEYETVFPAP